MPKHKPKQSEKEFLAQIIELAEHRGWAAYHVLDQKTYSRRTSKGFPDLVLARPPHIIFAEIKSDEGRLSPEQEAWLQLLSKCDGIKTYIWRPLDWDNIVKLLV
ncbi:MAG: hypothetical protein DDT32_02208 [Syntrophomonadaceae bacterium]|nr:hypothetical protein [Bacillota bacterium]